MPKSAKKSFVLSDESVNSYGFVLLNSGADWSLFRRNPIMLYAHSDDVLPIGTWENLRLEDGKWIADPAFDGEDDFAKQIAGKVERGILRMASISVDFDWDDVLPDESSQTCTVRKWLAREASVVPIGSNRNAFRLFDHRTGDEVSGLQLSDRLKNLKSTPMNLKEIAKQLNLADTATESDISSKITTLLEDAAYKSKFEALQLKLSEARKAEAVKLFDQAVADKRLPANTKERYLKLADADFDLFKETVEGLPKAVNLTAYAQEGAKAGEFSLSDQNDKDAAKWDELFKNGKLETLKAVDLPAFKRLYKAKFNKDFADTK